MRLMVTLPNMIFSYCLVNHVNILEIGIILWTPFQMIDAWYCEIIMVRRSTQSQGRPMNSDIIKHEKIIDKFSDSTLQLICKNLPFVEFYYLIKEEYTQ